jgi:universal stress protein E
MEFTNILVVYDPTREDQLALQRAAVVAAETSAKVHVFACIHEEIGNEADKAQEIRSRLATRREQLEAAVAPLLDQGITATTEVEWDRDWYHAVVRASMRAHADVVFKSSYRHSAGQRVLNKTSDFTLIRECLCPVLLVKEETPRDVRKVLAAIDIRQENSGYEKLNERIIDFTRRVMDSESAEVHFINAHKDLGSFPDRNALIRDCGVDSDRIHIKLGRPEDVIAENARGLDVSLVVVGNSARSGLSALVNGNTVEKVVDKVECDILALP